MANESYKKLSKELREFVTDPRPGMTAALTDEENMYKWHALLFGPPDTVFQDGTFRLLIEFPLNYPRSAPKVKFLTKMFHPNVWPDGRVCMDLLCGKWSDGYIIADILNAILVLLEQPNVNSAANGAAAELYKKHPGDTGYVNKVKEIVKLSETFNPRDGADANKNYNV